MKRDFSTPSGNSFTVSYANCVENGYNYHFPKEVVVNNADNFLAHLNMKKIQRSSMVYYKND